MALVLGCDVGNCLAAIRALGRKQIPLAVAVNADGLVARSRHYRPWPVETQPEPANLGDYLTRTALPGGVLIPCTDNWVRALSQLPLEEFSRRGLCWSAPPRMAAEICLDKARFAERLDRLDLSRPRTWFPDRGEMPSPGELAGCFLKPCDSGAFAAQFGSKGFPLTSAGEAQAAFQRCREAGLAVIVQELIPGPASQHYFLDGFVDRHGNIPAMFARRRLRAQEALSNSSCLVSIDRAVMREPERELRTLLAAIGYRGLFSTQFKLDARDGRFKFIEVNTRVWGDMALALKCGVDVVEMTYRDAQGLDVPELPNYQVGQHWVGLYRDRAAARRLVRAGELSRAEWFRQWKGAVFDILSIEDPRPAAYDAWLRVRWRWQRVSAKASSAAAGAAGARASGGGRA